MAADVKCKLVLQIQQSDGTYIDLDQNLFKIPLNMKAIESVKVSDIFDIVFNTIKELSVYDTYFNDLIRS